VKVLPMGDRADEEAGGVFHPEAVLVLVHRPRRRKSPGHHILR
jgi:hypothetical protein